MRQVRIISRNPQIDITVPMGDGPAVITAGLGGWTSIERIEDIALTSWEGQEPLQQDVPLLLDGFADNDPVEQQMNTIFKLGRDAWGNENVPPVFKVFGPVFFDETAWVLPASGIELDPNSTIRRDDGALLRQAFTLHLLEYINPNAVKLKKRGRIGLADNVAVSGGAEGISGNVAVGGTYTTKAGDTLIKIAVAVYGNWQHWQKLGNRNGINDPNRKLPAGRVLLVP